MCIRDRKKAADKAARRKEPPTFGKQKGKKRKPLIEDLSDTFASLAETVGDVKESVAAQLHAKEYAPLRLSVGAALTLCVLAMSSSFYGYSHQFAERSSQPQIMYRGQLQNGQYVMVDDYREAYYWLRDHTEKDARVMA